MEADDASSITRLAGLVCGPVLGVAAGALTIETLGHEGAIVVGLLTWMATWWLTVAVDLAATALLPALVLPFAGVGTFEQAASPYANDVIFLFAAGFVLSTALDRYGHTARMAIALVHLAGTRATLAIAALMIATALISSCVSNTATAATMLPIALALAKASPSAAAEDRRRLAGAATLGVAYAATIGGVLTIIGSPPNAIAARYIETESGQAMSFADWIGFGAPIAILLLPLAWLVLVGLVYPIGHVRLAERIDASAMGLDAPPERGRGVVLAIFLLTVAGWLTKPLWGSYAPVASDSNIALLGAVALLVIPRSLVPYRPLLAWRDLAGMPWGVLILFGGGLSLSVAIDRTGVASGLTDALSPLAWLPIAAVIVTLVTITCFGSELASNTALAATAMPLTGAIAASTGSPLDPIAVAAALGASLAFMLPVGTPPNAMAYASGHVRSRDMMKAGFLLNLGAIAVVSAVVLVRSR